jgi:hypothetical protein
VKRLLPVPWIAPPPDVTGFARSDLNRLARFAAGECGGKLLDWRILLPRRGSCAHACLEVRYLLSDGIARSHHVAI